MTPEIVTPDYFSLAIQGGFLTVAAAMLYVFAKVIFPRFMKSLDDKDALIKEITKQNNQALQAGLAENREHTTTMLNRLANQHDTRVQAIQTIADQTKDNTNAVETLTRSIDVHTTLMRERLTRGDDYRGEERRA